MTPPPPPPPNPTGQPGDAPEDVAASLTHWQVLDIVHVHTHGTLQIGAAAPWKPLRELIDADVLKLGVSAARPCVVQGQRFRPVLESLWRSGRVARPAEVVL